MGSDQRFSLKWNNYQSHLVTAFESLLGDKDFVDVTLGSEGRKLPAHKMLLSACSPYFRELLKDNPCQHPIIILRDVRYEDLYSLLQFMYNGEVNVAQDQLNSFLKSAEALKIRGLTDNDDSEGHSHTSGGRGGGSSSRAAAASPLPPAPSAAASSVRKRRPAPESITPLSTSSPHQPPSKRAHHHLQASHHTPAALPHHRVTNNSSSSSSSEPVKQEIIDLGEDNIEMEGEAEGAEYNPVEGSGGGGGGGGSDGTVAVQYEGGGGYGEEEDGGGDGGMLVPEDENIDDSLGQEQGGGSGGQGGEPYWENGEEEELRLVHECELCKRSFKLRTSLNHHMKIHTGECTCPVCGKVLSNKANLSRHMQIHATTFTQ